MHYPLACYVVHKLRRVKSMDNQFGVSKPVPTKFLFNGLHMGDTRTNCAQEFALSEPHLFGFLIVKNEQVEGEQEGGSECRRL